MEYVIAVGFDNDYFGRIKCLRDYFKECGCVFIRLQDPEESTGDLTLEGAKLVILGPYAKTKELRPNQIKLSSHNQIKEFVQASRKLDFLEKL